MATPPHSRNHPKGEAMRFLRVVSVIVTGIVFLMLGLPAQATPTPIAVCGFHANSAGNYKVTTDLGPCTQSGIIVGHNNVSIDLKGHTITGDRSAGHFGIDDAAGFDNILVKNGALRRFDDDVHGIGANHVNVHNIVASGAAGNGIYIEGNSARVTSSEASGNGGLGVWIFGVTATVISTEASANHSSGIALFGVFANVTSSHSYGNGSDGDSFGGTVTLGSGIGIFGNAASVVSSVASGNTQAGIKIVGQNAIVRGSRASGNTQFFDSNPFMFSNVPAPGIWIQGDSADVKSSRASGNYGDGIRVAGNAATINKNVANANGFVKGASDSVGLGIVNSDFTTAPSGHDSAIGNDDPAECSAPIPC